MGFGHRVESDDDPFLGLSGRLDDVILGLGGAGASMIDFLPFRKLLGSCPPVLDMEVPFQ